MSLLEKNGEWRAKCLIETEIGGFGYERFFLKKTNDYSFGREIMHITRGQNQ